MKKEINKKSNLMNFAVIGATLAGLAATSYFFFGPNAKRNQKHAKAWAIKMKADVIEKLEVAKSVSEPLYHEIIDAVAKRYLKNNKVDPKEVMALASDLKDHWKTISKTVKKVKNIAPKVEAKAVKKSSAEVKKMVK